MVTIDGDHDDMQSGQAGFEAGGELDAGHAGQVDVHQHDIRLERGDGLQGLLSIGEETGAGAAGCTFDQAAQSFAEGFMVFHNRNGGNRERGGVHG